MNQAQLFQQYRNQVRAYAWKYAKAYRLDFEEMEAQGNMIFAEALTLYDPARGVSFLTYLTHRLRKLGDFANSEIRRGTVQAIGEKIETVQATDVYTLPKIDENGLTDDALVILDYVLSFRWDTPGKPGRKTPPYREIENHYREHGWASETIQAAWDELKYWFRSGMAVA